MRQVWFTDCRSLSDTLRSPKMTKHEDKRLSIEIAALRESLWRAKGEDCGDPYYLDDRPSEPTDEVRWIDTDVMVADPLAKVPSASLLTTTCGRIARLSAAVPKSQQVMEDPVAVEAKRSQIPKSCCQSLACLWSQSRPVPSALAPIRGRGRLAQEGCGTQRRWKSDALASASAARRGSQSHSCLEDMLCKDTRLALAENACTRVLILGLAAVCRMGRDVAKSHLLKGVCYGPGSVMPQRTEMLTVAMDLPKARWPPRRVPSQRRPGHMPRTPGVLCLCDAGGTRPQSTIPAYCVTCVKAVLAGTDTVNMFADRLDIVSIAALRDWTL
eukprot:s6815_g1.t1